MSITRSRLLAGCVVVVSIAGACVPALAQYRGYDPDYAPRERYDRSDRYERRDGYDRRPDYDRGSDRGPRGEDRRGYGGDDRRGPPGPMQGQGNRQAPGFGQAPGYGQAPGGRNDPMAGMDMEERKQAIKNHREAQKKAIKRGYVIP